MAGTSPPSSWSDLNRPPLDAAGLRRALTGEAPAGWRAVEVVAATGSTNADLAARARVGEPAGLVLAADHQTAGRGRRERSWESPPRAGIAVSVLLRPPVPAARLGWVPLIGGLAVAEALRRVCGLPAAVKWPNDVLVPDPDADPDADGPTAGRKVAGLLAEVVTPPAGSGLPPAVVLGIGLNVNQTRSELPPGVPATSLLLAGSAVTDRGPVLRAVLRALAGRLADWERAGGDPLAGGVAAAYRETCSTIGAQVRVHLPDGAVLDGAAEGVDDDGRLLVRAAGEVAARALSAGDVVHVRRAEGA